MPIDLALREYEPPVKFTSGTEYIVYERGTHASEPDR